MDKIHKNGRGGNKFGDPKVGQKKRKVSRDDVYLPVYIEVHAT